MARRLRTRLEAEPPPFPFEVIEAGAEKLPVDDASFDTVVSTLVLCTVDDPGRAAAEIARVTAPDGRLLLYEHVRDPHEGRKARAAGFDVSGLAPDEFPKAPPLVSDTIKGSARRQSG